MLCVILRATGCACAVVLVRSIVVSLCFAVMLAVDSECFSLCIWTLCVCL